ncbi:MAG: 16S rRNA (cytidine(1402)-2'-O)-methyltransferase [Aeromicrobium sp.]|uniref:16S rRNA (cytidine(1402)-2'-O)-methyltransferase n=1 Tax=Aeromicrobium sp. TaxID=1871063 RepID=UPI0039E28FB9
MLILAGTPIGQVADASSRLGPALESADVIAAEDTRRLSRLASDLGVRPTGKVVSFFEGNEQARTVELAERLVAGDTIVLVTDAGMPSVSDPGYRLVAAAVGAGVEVSVIPGPSAVLTALAISGLPVDRFAFEGFPPRKAGARDKAFAELASERRTLVFFESPHRTAATLASMRDAFGADRPAVVCRELTKTYEEVVRGPLAELVAWAESQEHGVRGEVTLVVSGAPDEPVDLSPASLAALVEAARADGMSRKDAVAHVVAATGAPKNTVYAAAHG